MDVGQCFTCLGAVLCRNLIVAVWHLTQSWSFPPCPVLHLHAWGEGDHDSELCVRSLSSLAEQTKPMLKSTGRQHPWLWIVNTNLPLSPSLSLSFSASLLLSWQALSQLPSRCLSCIYGGERGSTHSSSLWGFSCVSLVCCSIFPCSCEQTEERNLWRGWERKGGKWREEVRVLLP